MPLHYFFAPPIQPAFWRGARQMAEVSVGVGAWGLVTGVAMVKSGMSFPLALFMSLVVYAGSAQLAALPLLAAGSPLWLLWATALCVNLRFVIFSSHWQPYFAHLPRWKRLFHAYMTTDMGYVLFMREHPTPPEAADRAPAMAHFWGGSVTNWLAWQIPSIIGIGLAEWIPQRWGIEFAGTMALVALTCSLVRDVRTALTLVLAAAVAVMTYEWPLRLNLVAAIVAAVALGIVWERFGDRRGAHG